MSETSATLIAPPSVGHHGANGWTLLSRTRAKLERLGRALSVMAASTHPYPFAPVDAVKAAVETREPR